MEIFKHHRSLYQIESFDKRLLSDSISSNSETNEERFVSQTLLTNDVQEEHIDNLQVPSPVNDSVDVNQQDNIFQENSDEKVCNRPGSGTH